MDSSNALESRRMKGVVNLNASESLASSSEPRRWDLNRSPDHNDDGADSQQLCFPVLEMGPTPGALAGSVSAELVASSSSSPSEPRRWDLNRSPDHNDDGADSQQFCFPVLEMGPTPGALAGSVAAELVASSSSSSSEPSRWKYDVFLSFRGPDTRKGIANDICNRLSSRGIKTFMDEQGLEVGDVISPALIKAIKESRFAIVILSKNYASSAWCLEELREICLSREENRILPLFYEVDSTDVRYQKRSFEEAFSKHETSQRHESEKVNQWRAALRKVANISGWNTNDFKTHNELVDKIVESLRSKVPLDPIESTGDFQAYEATKEAMSKVMEALKDDKITTVGVYGMGGVGKTSMVRHVAAQVCRNGTFNRWIMATISQNHDLKKSQGTLAELMGFNLQEETEDGRAARLRNEIMRKEKLLIIMDDIWGFIDLSRIGIPSYEELQKFKSKVLLTTRRLNVCHAMKCHKQISLNILSEQDSWSLFVRKTRSFDTPDFEGVARKVAGECRGLPIALIAVARALGDKDLAEWRTAAQQLKKSQIANPDHDDTAFECLKLSYDYLKDEDYKSCFLLCCLFPEDYHIPIEELFTYAIGKGLFRDTDTIYEARAIADTVFKHLIDSSLLLDGEYSRFYDGGRVRMHDVVRDTAMRIAKCEDGHGFLVRAGCGLKDWSCRSHEDYYAISLMKNELHSLPVELIGPKLQILLLQRNWHLNEIPETFSQSRNELRVLDLSGTNISLLPQSFSLLTKLQALHLDFCGRAVDISIVGKLKKLEILSIRGYPHTELSREIGNLTNLRMLDIADSEDIVTIPSEVISKLHRLEELYCGFVNWESPVEGEGDEINIGFGELAGLSKLKILQVSLPDAECIPKNVEVEPGWFYFDIRIGPDVEDFNNNFDRNHRKSRFLLLREMTISTVPDWFIKAVIEKTEKLVYVRCEGMSDIVMEYDLGSLHKLKHLTVEGVDELKELMNTTRRVETGPVFENLEELHLIDLYNLEELCVGELPPGSLSNLKVLHIYRCVFLKSVSKFVHRLPNLEKLYLNWIEELEYVFGCEGCEPEQSKLSEMHLLNLRALRSICNGPAPRAMFQSLKILTVFNCKLLQTLFASDVADCLVQLEDLLVEWCPLLERVTEAVNKDKTVLPNLKNLVLKYLPMLYGPSDTTVDIECPSLERLVVVDCPQLPFSTSSDLFYDLESQNQFSFSTSASDYFGSTNPVQLNDLQLYEFLRDRCEEV